MEFIINKSLTKKLKNIKEIGTSSEDGLIMGISKEDKFIQLSQEVMELVCISLMDKKKCLVEFCNLKYKVTIEQV